MGDFNVEPGSGLMTTLKQHMDDGKDASKAPYDMPEGTFNAFQFENTAMRRIDYIMLSKLSGLGVKSYAVLRDSHKSKYPSDHFPVIIKLKMN